MTDATKLPPLPEPFDYCYEWDGPYGTRKFSTASHNGRKPERSVPLFNADQMHACAEAARAPLLAEIEALRKRAEDAERAIAWQPIETAPKDRTEILAWREDCGQFIASYTSADSFPLTQDELDRAEEEWLFSENWFTQWPQALRLEGSEVPTHWKPLGPGPIDAAIKGSAA